MSMIKFVICIAFIASTISAVKAPTDVYSAIIYNAQNGPIRCNLVWSKPEGQTLQSGLFTIQNKQNYRAVEQLIDMGTWEAHAVIKQIRCADLVLSAPFEGVQSPQINWKFTVYPDKIVSG